MPVEKGKNITGKYYTDIVLKKPKKYQKRRPVTGFKHIRLLHGNVPALAWNSYGVFEERKSNCFVSPPVFPRSCPMWFLWFRNWNNSLLGGNTSPHRPLDLLFNSTLLLCPNQRTVTPSRSVYMGWSFAFLAMESSSMAWNEHFWANLKFEVPR